MLRSTIVLNIFGFLSVSFLVVQAKSQKNSPKIIEIFMKNNIMSKFNESSEQHLLHQFQNRNLKWIGDILYLTMKDFKPISNENSKCERDGILYRENLLNQSLWAVQMYDSSSKYPGGLLSRNIFNLGYFDQCLKVSAKWLNIYSAYSIVTLEFDISKITDHSSGVYPNITAWEELEINNNPWINKNNKIHLAICVPNSCKPADIQKSVEIILVPAFKFYNITTQISVNPSMYTPSNTNSKFKPESLKIGVFFFLVLLIVMIGTIYDILLEKTGNKEKMLEILLRAFSLSSNINELINNSTDKTIFSSINCLKTMGIIIIVFGHRLTLEFSSPSENFEFIENIYTHFWLAPLKSPVGVEVFFVISGFLTFVVVLNRLKEKNENQIFVIILNRLVRILPVYLAVVFLYIYILPNLSNGPLWKNIVYPEVEYCKTNWWTNVLFVNNYVNTREMCMIPAWYLACDMHFFIIGLLLINIIWRWEKIGLMIFGSIFTISIFLPAKHIYSHKLWGVMHYTQSNMSNLRDVDHFNQIYIKSHHRLMTYLVGIAAGYIYTKFKDDEFKFSKFSKIVGSILCIILHNLCYFATGCFYLPEVDYNPWHHVVYFTVQRLTYSLVIVFILLVDATSNLGILKKCMSCSIFSIIAQLTYSIYLVHFIVLLQDVGSVRNPSYMSYWILVQKSCSDLVLSTCYALILYLFIEAPFKKILKPFRN